VQPDFFTISRMKKLGNSVFPVASALWADAGNASSLVADWIGEIKSVWARGSSSTLDLVRAVSGAKNRLQQHYGQWSRLWKSEQKMSLSKSTADQLAVIGQQMGRLDSQTSENLPRGWNILFCLAPLDRGTLEQQIQQGFIHPNAVESGTLRLSPLNLAFQPINQSITCVTYENHSLSCPGDSALSACYPRPWYKRCQKGVEKGVGQKGVGQKKVSVNGIAIFLLEAQDAA
jgi:hypothetical protein